MNFMPIIMRVGVDSKSLIIYYNGMVPSNTSLAFSPAMGAVLITIYNAIHHGGKLFTEERTPDIEDMEEKYTYVSFTIKFSCGCEMNKHLADMQNGFRS